MDLVDSLRYVSALVFVLALIGGLAWTVRYFKLAEKFANLGPSSRRLKVIESLPLDARHRLMIIGRDNAEHLIVLGPSGETVVETNITAPAESSLIPIAIRPRQEDASNNPSEVTPRLQGGAS